VQIPRDQVVSLIRDRLGDREAQLATRRLPDQVDHEQDAELLRKYHITVPDLLQRFGGSVDQRSTRKAVGDSDQTESTDRWRYSLMNWGHDPLK
jgi:hypothetical protein